MRDLAQAREQRSRVDILIRAFAAQDTRTGLTNRISFDSHLDLQLEDNQDMGTYGVVLLIMRPDPERLTEHLGPAHAAVIDGALINVGVGFGQTLPGRVVGALFFRDDLLHIGVSAYYPGQMAVEVMESAEHTAREAGLQGGATVGL